MKHLWRKIDARSLHTDYGRNTEGDGEFMKPIDLWEMGHQILPVAGKKPACKWMEWQWTAQSADVASQITSHFSDLEFGIITGFLASDSGLLVVDADNMQLANWWKEWFGHRCSVQVKTPKGMHFWYSCENREWRNRQGVLGGYDIRANGGYVRCPGTCDGYSFVKGNYFTPLNPPPHRARFQRPIATHSTGSYDSHGKDGLGLIRHITAVEGQQGHKSTYHAVSWLKDNGFGPGDTSQIIRKWNQTNAFPPWSDRELDHKVRSVFGETI